MILKFFNWTTDGARMDCVEHENVEHLHGDDESPRSAYIKLLCKEEFAEVPEDEAQLLRWLLTHRECVC